MSRRDFLRWNVAAGALASGFTGGLPIRLQAASELTLDSAFDRIPWTRYQIGGRLGEYLHGVTEQWFKVAPASNPAMLEVFRDCDRRPLREMVPRACEFAGKYLTSAVQMWRVTDDESLRNEMVTISALEPIGNSDGFLTGNAPQRIIRIVPSRRLWRRDSRSLCLSGVG